MEGRAAARYGELRRRWPRPATPRPPAPCRGLRPSGGAATDLAQREASSACGRPRLPRPRQPASQRRRTSWPARTPTRSPPTGSCAAPCTTRIAPSPFTPMSPRTPRTSRRGSSPRGWHTSIWGMPPAGGVGGAPLGTRPGTARAAPRHRREPRARSVLWPPMSSTAWRSGTKRWRRPRQRLAMPRTPRLCAPWQLPPRHRRRLKGAQSRRASLRCQCQPVHSNCCAPASST